LKIALFAALGLFIGAVVGAAVPFALLPFWDSVTPWLDALPGSCAGDEFCGEQQFFGLLIITTALGAVIGAAALGVLAARRRRRRQTYP
jgi:hypothetical protein